MAITLVSQPSTITPSRNPVVWKFSTNSYVAFAGTTAVTKFTVSGAVSAFEGLTIIYDDVQFSMTAVNSPAAPTGYNLPTGDGGTSHKGNMLLYFQANYYLNRDFVITLVGNDFIFTAREVGSAYTISGTDTFANGAWSVTTAGVDKSYNENFFFLVDVYVEEVHLSGTYTRLFSRYLKPDESSVAEIDISAQLDGFLQKQFDAPTYNQTAYSGATNINKRYYITYCEQYGSTPVPFAQTTSSAVRVIKGGLRKELWPAVASNFRTLWLGVPLSTGYSKFLTTRQTKRRTATKAMPQYLYFCPGAAIANARLRARVDYSNNTNTTTTIGTTMTLGAGLTYCFPAGYDLLNLASIEAGRTPVRFYVYIDNTAGLNKSEVVCCELEEPSFYDRFFLYENSLGGWDTLRTSGQAEYGVEVEKEEFQKLLDFDYAATDGEFSSSETLFREGTEVYTGHKNKLEIEDVIDFLNARKYLQVISGKHVPITVDKGSFGVHRDDNYAYGLKFTYKLSYEQTNAGWR